MQRTVQSTGQKNSIQPTRGLRHKNRTNTGDILGRDNRETHLAGLQTIHNKQTPSGITRAKLHMNQRIKIKKIVLHQESQVPDSEKNTVYLCLVCRESYWEDPVHFCRIPQRGPIISLVPPAALAAYATFFDRLPSSRKNRPDPTGTDYKSVISTFPPPGISLQSGQLLQKS